MSRSVSMSVPMFGTDGVRGTPGIYPLDEQTLTRIGAAIAQALSGEPVRLLAGRDTRESGPWIERHLARGVSAVRGTLVSTGVLPTPAIAFLTAARGFDAGIVISASHNPFPDNGVKVLTATGEKAPPELEARIEALVADTSWKLVGQEAAAAETVDLSDAYVAHARQVLAGGRLGAWRVAVDCANGATTVVAARVLKEIGFDVVAINDVPNGRNINERCGSIHPEGLMAAVTAKECRLGIAFDGDGDRVILVDDRGAIVDGDAMLFICARHLQAAGRLTGNAIVATVMSNIGLEAALRETGISVHRCPVGDRNVRETMLERGVVLGGEQSGHIILDEWLPTGDGLLTALSVIRVMADTGRTLSDLASELETYPQALVNVPVRDKPPLDTIPDVADAIHHAEGLLADNGRVLVRYSGTEPLLRVMIEGRDQAVVQELAGTIAERVRKHLS